MPKQPATEMSKRTPLSRDRVLEAAVAIADKHGIAAVTMRSLADDLGVKPMSLYYHVKNKDDILDGIVDAVVGKIGEPTPGEAWRPALRRRMVSMHEVLRRHPWALGLLDSRVNAGPATLRQHNANLGLMFDAGFSLALAGHAYAILDAFVYGFSLQESALPFDGPDSLAELAEPFQQLVTDHPHMSRFLHEHVLQPGYDFGHEFEFGLDLILDSIARLRSAESRAVTSGRGPKHLAQKRT
jgi:AcrR family transcriptional regulator